jgi:L-methionine (R)-S-oxide reductase
MNNVYAECHAILRGPLDRLSKARALAEALQHAKGYHWVGLYDVTATNISAIAWTGKIPPAFPTFPRSQGLNGAAVAAAQPVIVQDVGKDPRWLTTFGSSKAEAIFPIAVQGVIVGTIDVESDVINAFTEADESFLARAAQVLQPLWARDIAV